MKRLTALLTVTLCLCGLLGCGHWRDYVDITRDKGISKEYLASLKEWTRSQTVYSQFETMVHISATHQSGGFRKAYLDEQTRINHLQQSERKLREEGDLDADEFLFYAYTPDKQSNDFDRQGSIWQVFLVSQDGRKINPVEVRRIYPVTLTHREFFPYINPYYGVAYTLRFPPHVRQDVTSGALKLAFTSVIGKVELDFKHRL